MKEIINLLNTKERKKIYLLILFSSFISILEVFNFALLIPFITLISDTSIIFKYKKINELLNYFFITNNNIVIIIAIFIIFISIFKLFILSYYNKIVSTFLNVKYLTLSKEMLQKILNMPYELYLKKDRSNLTKILIYELDKLNIIIKDSILVFSEIVIIISLGLIMLINNCKIFIYLVLFSSICVIFIKYIILNEIKKIGEEKSNLISKCFFSLETIFENLKGLKLILNEENIIINNYYDNTTKCLNLEKKWNILFPLSKQIFETLGMSIVIMVILLNFFDNKENFYKFITSLMIFIISLYRILPSIYRVITSVQEINYYKNGVFLIKSILNLPTEKSGAYPIKFTKNIIISNINFFYDEINIFNINVLEIKKGDKIGIIGSSGAGKSTFINIFLGLYRENLKNIKIDNSELTNKNIKSWHNKIAYIPQEIILFNGSIGENIIFGRKCNEEKLSKVIKILNLDSFFDNKDCKNIQVGDKGQFLSGGQKQRVVIARALYGEPEILILDEATSSLDTTIEKEIMKEIYNLKKDLTILIVTHRESTLYGCNRIIKFEKGKSPKEIKC